MKEFLEDDVDTLKAEIENYKTQIEHQAEQLETYQRIARQFLFDFLEEVETKDIQPEDLEVGLLRFEDKQDFGELLLVDDEYSKESKLKAWSSIVELCVRLKFHKLIPPVAGVSLTQRLKVYIKTLARKAEEYDKLKATTDILEEQNIKMCKILDKAKNVLNGK